MSLHLLASAPTALLRSLAPAALAGCRAVSTSAAARQQAPAAKRDADDADEFAKTPLRARVLSEEARQMAELLRRHDFGSPRRRTSQTFCANGGLPAALQGGQGTHATFAHNTHGAASVAGRPEANATAA
ncbi:hypothetical protein ABPG75_011083 [Micractinium tetrahymenae]